jgi:purine-nucleoside phosphorylase
MALDSETVAAEAGNYRTRVEEAVAFLRTCLGDPPEICLILGTGLGGLADRVQAPWAMSFKEIPNFPVSTTPGHAGRLVCGQLSGRRVAVLQGRLHHYEGYAAREITLPLRVLTRLGCATLVAVNAGGGLNPAFRPGTLMLIRDHLNFIPDNPLRGPNVEEWGPRFPDLSRPYDHRLIELALEEARKLGMAEVVPGVYAAVPGPSLETPAETRFLRRNGADAVGMSTVPEVIVARQAGLRVLAISVIGNVNDPEDFQPILIEEVLDAMAGAAAGLERLLLAVLPGL